MISLLLAFLIITNLSYYANSQITINAQISAIKPYTVYVGQAYALTVNVQYNIPLKDLSYLSFVELWVSSPPAQSSKFKIPQPGGSGTHSFTLALTAPTQPGSYTLGIKLYANSKMHKVAVIDTATVNYQVIQPTVNDWAVTKIWVTPDPPAEGDEVIFHANIALKSTNSKDPQIAKVFCYLNGKPFGKTQVFTFQSASSMGIQASRKWIATEGTHRLRFVIEDYNLYRDPFLKDNMEEILFPVEPYYAIIKTIRAIPKELSSGDDFEVTVTVEYKFSETTNLRIDAIWPIDNNTLSFDSPYHAILVLTMPTTEEILDTVSDTGERSYVFNLETPRLSFTRYDDIEYYVGWVKVEFDRGRGGGWQHTDPGYWGNFTVMIHKPRYFAIFKVADVAYMGEAKPFDPLIPRGRFKANLEIEYFLPEEAGASKIKITMLDKTNGIKLYDVTEGAKDEGKRTYPIEFDIPLDLKTKDYNEAFEIKVLYMVEDNWYFGDSRSKATSVSISQEAIEAISEPADKDSPLEQISDFFEGIGDFFKGLFK